jgi:hypothetical protein
LKVGQLQHRLLAALVADFYRPIRVAAAYVLIYPGEYFNPVSSPARVHEAVKRLRQWLEAQKLTITIEESSGAYRLVSTAPCSLRIPSITGSPLARHSPIVDKLRQRWPREGFTIQQASELLKTPARSTLRLLEEAIRAGSLERVGKGRATRYHVFAPEAKKSA